MLKHILRRKNRKSRRSSLKQPPKVDCIKKQEEIHSEPRYVKNNIPYITIYQSDLSFVAAISAHAGKKETVMDLYGYFIHGGVIVIQFVAPPGPNAIQEIASCRQDIDYLKRNTQYLHNEYGLSYVGNCHNHHLLMEGLSPRDENSTHAIARKNGFDKFCQLLITFKEINKESITNDCMNSDQVGRASTGFPYNIQIHAYYYENAAYGKPVKTPLRVISGTSPIRKALQSDPEFSEIAKQHNFPMSRIIYDDVDNLESQCVPTKLPARIYDEIRLAAESSKVQIEATLKDDLIILSLPMAENKGVLYVIYNSEAPYEKKEVFFCKDLSSESSINLTDLVLRNGPSTPLVSIFNVSNRILYDGIDVQM